MGFTDIFKGKQYKSELDTLQQKYEDLQSLLTPEMQNAFALQNKIRDLDSIIQQRNQTISDCDNTIISKNAHLKTLKDISLTGKQNLFPWMKRYWFRNSDYINRIMISQMHWSIKKSYPK